MRRPKLVLPFVVALVGITSAASDAQSQDNPWRWQKSIARGSTVEIRGVIGDVVAVPSTGNEVEVVARISDGNDVRIVAVDTDNGVRICALYPQGSNDNGNTCDRAGNNRGTNSGGSNNKDNDTRVDFEVRVPNGVRFEGYTVAGDVRATGMTAFVSASSVSGDVHVSTTDLARASSVSGSVDVTMGRSDWADRLSFSSVSGNVTLTIPGDLDTEFSASTVSGEIESDWPVTVTKASPRSMRGTIGRGGRSLNLSSVSGDITLRRR